MRSRPPYAVLGPHMPLTECIKAQYVRLGTEAATELIASAARQLAEATEANEKAKAGSEAKAQPKAKEKP